MLKNQKHPKYLEIMQTVLMIFFGTYGITYISRLAIGTIFTNSIFSIVAFILLLLMIPHTVQDIHNIQNAKARKKRLLYSFFIALAFSLSLVLGYQLKAYGMTDGGFLGKILILVRSLFLSFFFFPFSNRLFKWAEQIRVFSIHRTANHWRFSTVFLISWSFIFLSWFPVLLAYYPAVMSFDFHRQSQEALHGFAYFYGYQPLIHTWFIWLSFQFGNLFDSLQIGMVFYSVIQMLILSVSCAYACTLLYRMAKRKWALILTSLFFCVFPYISILSVTATKDVIFSALFLIFVCLFIERTFFATGRKQLILDILWVLEGIFMSLFRNNALYALAVFAIIYIIFAEKKKRLRVFLLLLCLIFGGKLASEGMYLALGTELRGSQVEMFSVPIQQFGRVGKIHAETLDEETFALINTYIPQKYWDAYNPPISDSIKIFVGQYSFHDTWEGHYPQLFLDWMKVGMKYPNEYIDAFLELTAGYWFIDDVTWAEVLGYGVENRMGALYTYNSTVSDILPEGIDHKSMLPSLESFLEEIVSGNSFYNWPVFSNLFKPAFYCWLLFLLLVLCFYNLEKKKLFVILIPFIYFLTLLLGPVVQVRYILQFILLTPLLLALFIYSEAHDDVI